VTIGSALVTQMLNLHYVLGAFIAGAVMPDELRRPILDRVQVMTIALLMPFFFLLTGLRTVVDVSSSVFLEVFSTITAAAVIGKLAGTAFAARIVGESWPNALALGSLLQTKGLMDLIVLTILLDQGIISVSIFSALILMPVVSTALAQPIARSMLAQASDRIPNKS
jgi:Kef-type K+ transport system membrane component KefB